MIEVETPSVAHNRHRRPARTDAELIDSIAGGNDEAAFAELVRRHGPLVLGVCRRALRDRHLAEDAFQVTFMVLAKKAKNLQHPDRLGNWLYGVANRVAWRTRRAEARRLDAEGRSMQIRMDNRPTTHPAASHLQSFLDDEIRRLPAKYRAALVACHIEGKTNREAARQLGWPEGTLVTRLNRAKQMLRVRAAERGGAQCAGAMSQVLTRKLSPSIVPALLLAKTTAAVSNQTATGVVQTAQATSTPTFVSKAARLTALGKTNLLGVGLIAISVGLSALVITPARSRQPVELRLPASEAPDRTLLATAKPNPSANPSAQEHPATTQLQTANRPPEIFGCRDNSGTASGMSQHLMRGPFAQLTRPIHIAAAPASTSTKSLHQ